ncbi:MAG: type II toxin-antitoxin system RelE/ParE family toxin [Firmicutes bacterium]|nr:type II toxin-antitoxin system RelE/ParE family toxin [Bacillota bacterium]
MKNKLHYSPEALNDLNEIWEYVANDAENENVANHLVSSIFHTIDQLESFSALGPTLYSVTGRTNEYRYLVSGNYLVFYRTIYENVYIDRIIHSRRDYMRILFDEKLGE